MIVIFYKALPWVAPGLDRPRRQTMPHEAVGVNPTEVQLVEEATAWSDKDNDYWCSAITLRRSCKDDLPLIVVGKMVEIIRRLNQEGGK